MKFKLAIISTITLLSEFCAASVTAADVFPNEKQIEFAATNGTKVAAYEGHYFVPENRNNPKSRTIRVNYVRFPATGKFHGAPIVYLAGGPGGSGISTAKNKRFDLFMALREYGDVIALDQRGTGVSESAPPCVSSVTVGLNEVITKTEIDARYKQAAQECFTNWQAQGIDVYGYTSVQNALDIRDLRKHLNADKVTLWGISYGSHLAMTALKYMPDEIEKVIIASAEGLNQTVKLPSETDAYFSNVQSIINKQALKDQVPDLPELMKRVHMKLAANPVTVTVPKRGGEPYTLLFQKHHMQMLASMMIADPNQYLAMLIQVYQDLDKGNYALLQNILGRGIFAEEHIHFRLMSLAMDVASGISNERLARVRAEAASSLLGEALNFPMPALALIDKKLDLGDDFRTPLKSNVPTLLLTGSLDGRTYPSEQIQSVTGLSKLTQVTVTNAGHNLYTVSPKVLEVMHAFMKGEKITLSKIDLPEPNLQFAMGK
ncbi:alpha/beta fold hydrolase [Pseudoalteromonas sp.]|uniref:alpha/beta fold hydrolase n=1 Tax=Pseudoalteromonas sp. TaxID=53249 RepID=UPI003561B812